MKIKFITTKKLTLVLFIVMASLTLSVTQGTVQAKKPGGPAPPGPASPSPSPSPSQSTLDPARCTGDATVCPGNDNSPQYKDKCAIDNQSACNPIQQYLNPFIKFLALLVGIAITAGIIWGGIQYSMSAGDPQKSAVAKNHIRNAVLALLAYLFLYAFMKFLVPGGNLFTG